MDKYATSSLDPAREANPMDAKTKSAPSPRRPDTPAFAFVRQLGVDLANADFDLPPFPDTALKVQQCVRDPDSDIQSVAAIVATEPALAARLMRMANSAMMRRGPLAVSDIPTAISRVGLDMVLSAAVSFAAREAFKVAPGSLCLEDLNALRRESVRVAAISYLLCRDALPSENADEAMISGLLNSVGKFYIFTKSANHPDLFRDRQILDQLLEQWHTGVARAIVESWDFPDSIALAVEAQDVDVRDRVGAADLSDILFLSQRIVRNPDLSIGELASADILSRMRTSADRLEEVMADGEEEIQSMIDALSS